jgi:Icc-related predicted phosphoesterase
MYGKVKNGKKIKVLSVSDVVDSMLHRLAGKDPFTDINVIISCGDLPPEYLSRLVNAFSAPLYYVSGNHDIRYKDKLPQGGFNLHGRLEKIGGIRFLGLEGSHWYNGGPFQYTEPQMRAVVRRLRPTLWWRGGVDVVVTHAPPLHIHDAEDPCHRGFECFRWLITKYQPQYFIHGHIHRHFSDPSEREAVVEATKVVNTYGYNILEIEVRPKAE